MFDSKQNLAKSQWGFIVITVVMDLVVHSSNITG
ncbi:hypothetical membrane spanning protein [Streptococcus pyogenes]|nr:hypothetical membrane spanning protein [Streptococcus pyogenes]VGR63958.1 hypothetical membrane spanning protein [Streptococcus pyogenes]VGR69352.1 hypothetical membrane spanning protein [Streptococcus pyogenes]VGU79574.1 hypothetical membrane spanning protein [Streptococcus pyogenes]VGV17290.1 hypothetical membrane spanning protein [Streptococcus pyogenes]